VKTDTERLWAVSMGLPKLQIWSNLQFFAPFSPTQSDIMHR